jgi:DNA-binding MarR family transcriptional regulator
MPATLSDTELEVFASALDEFMRAVRRARGRFAVSDGEEAELSLSQFQLLEPLVLAGDVALTVGEAAVQAGISPPSATRMVDALERDGLAARERRADDRRIVQVRATDEGRRRVESKRRLIAARRLRLFESLGPDERKQAARVLARLAAAVEDLR